MNLLSAARNVEYAATHGTLPVLDLRPYFKSTDTPGINECIDLIDKFENERGMRPVEVIAPCDISMLLCSPSWSYSRPTTLHLDGIPVRIAPGNDESPDP